MSFRSLILLHLFNILCHFTIWMHSSWSTNFQISLLELNQSKPPRLNLTRAKFATSNSKNKNSLSRELVSVRVKRCGQSQVKLWPASGVFKKVLSLSCASWVGSRLGNKIQWRPPILKAVRTKLPNLNKVQKQSNPTLSLISTPILSLLALWRPM
jgi:hypothetical protein